PSTTEVVDGAPLIGIVHDENARAMGGVAPHAGLFGSARDIHDLIVRTVGGELIGRPTLERFFGPSGIPESTWCLGWDRPSLSENSAAGRHSPRTAVGHLAFTGCSIWIDPLRPFWIICLSNRVHPTRENTRIRAFRPLLH